MADVVALLTARGGSKRLPRKNVLPFGGKPLIAWSIEAALAAPSVSRTIVSTDDPEIGATALQAGAEVPFVRPTALANDDSSHYDVVAHALTWLEEQGGGLPRRCLLLQPTTPLCTSADIEAIIALAERTGAESLVSVTAARHHPILCRKIDPAGRLQPLLPTPSGYLRTQDLEPAYVLNGALYLFRPAAFRARTQVLAPDPIPYVMPPERSFDIDDELDWACAEAALARR